MASSEIRAAAEAPAGALQPSGQPSLYGFQRLPSDLQARIITMACWLPKLPRHPQAQGYSSSVVNIDADTAKSLTLVCRASYVIVTKILFQHIRVTRPSTLRMLVDTVTRRPALGRIIESLHIGPEEVLPYDWFPIDETKALCVHLCGFEDMKMAPSWSNAPSVDRIAIESTCPGTGPPHAQEAMTAAVKAACDALDVDLLKVSCTRDGAYMRPGTFPGSGDFLHSPAWYCRVFEVYAAMELYMMQMPRCEESHTWDPDNTGNAYPRLVINNGFLPASSSPSESSAQSRVSPSNVLTLTRSQLLERLAVPRTRTDRFDHPLILARSDVAWQASHSYRQQHPRLAGPPFPHWLDGDAEDSVEANSLSVSLDDPILPATATIGGTLSLVASLLAQSPRLRNLSLGGFLERILCGPRAPTELKTLRSLSVGPPQQGYCWDPPLSRLATPSIAGIERLRVCGRVLSKEEATAILGGLPRLQHLQWSHQRDTALHDGEGKGSVLETVIVLAGLGEDGPSTAKRARDEDEEDGTHRSIHRPLFVETRLHPRDVEKILKSAHTPAVRTAWQEGTLPCYEGGHTNQRQHHRFLVKEARACDDGGHATPAALNALREMYGEGREWFEQEVNRAGRA